MSDNTRDADLRELYEARQGKSVAERENIEKIMYKIQKESEDSEIVEARSELVQAMRNQDGKHVRAVSERLKIKGYKEGTDRNG